METIPYKAYSSADTLRDTVTSQEVPAASGIKRYLTVSPFELPQSIEMTIDAPDRLQIRFWYPNDEPGESQVRQLSPDGQVTGRLAEHTKKVLELFVHDPLAKLSTATFGFDANYLRNQLIHQPPEALNAAKANIEVIASILAKMPPDFISDLARRLRSTPSR